jgi:hypothetical protein
MHENLFKLVNTLQRQLHDHVQALRLADLKARLNAVREIRWESETCATDEGIRTVTTLGEIHLGLETTRGKVWVSLGAGNIDDQRDRFVESLEFASGVETDTDDDDKRLALTTEALRLPGEFDFWSALTGLVLSFVEDAGPEGTVDVDQTLHAAAAATRQADREALAGILSIASAHAAGREVESYLIVSTGHVTEAERDLFDSGRSPTPWMVVSMTGDDGWLLHVADTVPESIPGLSDGLAAVVRHARAHGLNYIRLAADAPFIYEAPSYDW